MEEETQRTKDVEIIKNVPFSDMMLSKPVLAGLKSCNFEFPSPIQLRAIPIGRCGSDLIIKSKSGTGKTLVFCTIILERYDDKLDAPQSLIVVPTHEIALQVQNYLKSLSAKCPKFSVACVIGGRDINEDRKAISKCKAIVGTPGRLLHLIRNNLICLKHIQTLVLDEADKLFTDNFRKDIGILMKALKKDRQTIASSATYADDLDRLIVSYMQNAIAVSATREIPMLIGIRQFAYCIDSKTNENSASAPAIQTMLRKVNAIESILSHLAFKQCILFSNSQMRAESFANYLTTKEWTVDLIIGSQDQCIRTSTLDKFRQYKSRILITSDLMARGVDIENINLVINIDVPRESSTYLHRIGRCGRFGTKGIAITLISNDEDLTAFRKLLGRIDGNGLKIAKLPSAEYFSDCDPWNFAKQDVALRSFEYIYGLDEMVSNHSNHLDEDNESFTKLLTTLKRSSSEKVADEQDTTAAIQNVADLLTDSEQVDLDDDPFSKFEEFKCNGSMNVAKEHEKIEKCSVTSIEKINHEMFEVAKLLVDAKDKNPIDLESDPFQQFLSHTDEYNVQAQTRGTTVQIQNEETFSDITSSESSAHGTTSSDDGGDEASNREEDADTLFHGNKNHEQNSHSVEMNNIKVVLDETLPKEANILDATESQRAPTKNSPNRRPKSNAFQLSQHFQKQWTHLYRQQVHQIFEYVSNANHQWYY